LPHGSPLGRIDLASSAFFSAPGGPFARQVLADLLRSFGCQNGVFGDESQGQRVIEDSHGFCNSLT
jgi:hypothetical protein